MGLSQVSVLEAASSGIVGGGGMGLGASGVAFASASAGLPPPVA